jgi:hypothetical protein
MYNQHSFNLLIGQARSYVAIYNATKLNHYLVKAKHCIDKARQMNSQWNEVTVEFKLVA